MNQTILYALWGVLFALCAGLGFVPAPEGALRVLMVLLALLFFVPAYLLLYRASRTHDRRTLALLRNLAAASSPMICGQYWAVSLFLWHFS